MLQLGDSMWVVKEGKSRHHGAKSGVRVSCFQASQKRLSTPLMFEDFPSL